MFAKRSSTLAKIAGILLCGLLLWILMPEIGAEADPIQLNYYAQIAPNAGRFVNTYQPWFDAVEKACNGGVKINNLPRDRYKTYAEMHDALIKSEVDLFVAYPTGMPEKYPINLIYSIAGAGIKDTLVGSYVAWNLYKNLPEIQKEWGDVQVLLAHAYAPMVATSKDKPLRLPKDLAGRKTAIMAQEREILESAGGIFAPGTLIDAASRLETGVIDGNIIGWEGIQGFGVLDVAKYFTEISAFSGPSFFMVMNKQKWASLPPDIQKAIMSVSGDVGSKMFGQGDAKSTAKTKEMVKSQGGKEIVSLTPEEQAQWIELVKPFTDKRIKALEDKGLPARKVFDEMVRLVKEYKE